MREDRLRSQSQGRDTSWESVTDMLETGAEMAITVGAGHAAFGGRRLSRYVSQTRRFLRENAGELTSDLRRGASVASMVGKANARWRQAGLAAQRVELRTANPKGMFGIARQVIDQRNRAKQTLAGIWEHDNIRKGAIQDVTQLGIQAPLLPKIQEAIRKMSLHNLNDPTAFMEEVRRAGIARSEFGNVPAKDVLDILRRRKVAAGGDAARKKWSEEKAPQFQNEMDKAILNLDKLEEILGSSHHKSIKQGTVNTFRGDKPATVADLLATDPRELVGIDVTHKKDGKISATNVQEALLEMRNYFTDPVDKKRFDNLYVDFNGLRKDANGIFSTKDTVDMFNDMVDTASNTLPGKILKLRSFEQVSNSPLFYQIKAGQLNPVLASLTKSLDGHRVDSHLFSINNGTYEYNSSGHLVAREDIDKAGLYLASGRNGSIERLVAQMTGNASWRPSSNGLMSLLDIGQTGDVTMFDQAKALWGKYSDPLSRGNVANDFAEDMPERGLHLNDLRTRMRAGEDVREAIELEWAKTGEINQIFSKHTKALSGETLNKIVGALPQNDPMSAGFYFGLLRSNDIDHITRTITQLMQSGEILGQDLKTMTSMLADNPEKAYASFSLRAAKSGFMTEDGGREAQRFAELFKVEVVKEGFLRHAANNDSLLGSFDSIGGLLDSAGLEGEARKDAELIAYWGALQQKTCVSATQHPATVEEMLEGAVRTHNAFNENGSNLSLKENLQRVTSNIRREKFSFLETPWSVDPEEEGTGHFGDFIHVRNGVGVFDIIRKLNDATKLKETTKDFFMQFAAGADRPEHLTTYSMIPYFYMARLSDAMNTVGLGFSNESMGSSFDLFKNMMLKRVLPVAVGLGYADYLNDQAQETTGMSVTGAFSSGLGNLDLAMRKGVDALGLRPLLTDEKRYNPIAQYWGDKNDFQSYEERKGYYENGYDPVRKGAWWWFGSLNEFRGGKVQYFKPNSVREITSDAHDISLYGDSGSGKWGHSLLPTPTNPLAPLAYLLNPYYLEDRHKDDRPYPVSGSMFEEATPWGMLLNNTVGDWIKPRKLMNEDKMGDDFVDPLGLLDRMNQAIKDRANSDDGYLFRIRNKAMEPLQYIPAAPDQGFSLSPLFQGKLGIDPANYNFPGNVTVSGQPVGISDIDETYGLPPEDEEGGTGVGGGGGAGTGQPGMGIGPGQQGVGFGGGAGALDANRYMELRQMARISGTINEDMVSLQDFKVSVSSTLNDKERKQLDLFLDDDGMNTVNKMVLRLSPLEQIGALNEAAKTRASMNKQNPGGVLVSGMAPLMDRRRPWELTSDENEEDMLSLENGDGFIKDASKTYRLLSGLHGWALWQMFGSGSNERYMAEASDMDSYTRTFWDSSVGGLGGEVMEIVRRFIPQYRRRERFNPLRNTMPTWLPERYQYGDAYSQTPDGEIRLPGEGYKAAHQLHSDIFGEYGAFDRFQILADIAPNSPEYKYWRTIASKTITDPALKEQMKAARKRVADQMREHDFYEYKFDGRGIEYQTITVKDLIDANHFRSAETGDIYRLAGVKVATGEDGSNPLAQYLTPGSEVTIAVDENGNYRNDKDQYRSINASVFVGGVNINEELLQSGEANERKGDTSAAAYMPRLGIAKSLWYTGLEAVSHLNLPYINDKLLRVKSAMETYKDERIYGTPWQTWSSPIDTYLSPAAERMSSNPLEGVAAALAYAARVHSYKSSGFWGQRATDAALMLTSRGAFFGGMLGYIVRGGSGSAMAAGAKLGFLAQEAGYLYTQKEKPVTETMIGAGLGAYAASFVSRSKLKGGAIGAAMGMAISGFSTGKSILSGEYKGGEWIPERVRKNWEMQDYFDRLTYIKMQGMYRLAADKAKEEEDVDVDELLKQQKEDAQERERIVDFADQYSRKIKAMLPDGALKNKLLRAISARKTIAQESEIIVQGGEYTRAAILFNKAAEGTVFGLNEDSTYPDIVRALPKNERDFFLEFVKEGDPDKREEILRLASPTLKKALNTSWYSGQIKNAPSLAKGLYQKYYGTDQEDNETYFKNHLLPGPAWFGWRPDVDLANIKAKTVFNEGMLLGDFGIYETQVADPAVINAPTLDDPSGDQDPSNAGTRRGQAPSDMQERLKQVLAAQGLKNVEVRVERSNREDVLTVANIVKVGGYSIGNAVQSIFSAM